MRKNPRVGGRGTSRSGFVLGDHMVTYFPLSREVLRENPLPARAQSARAVDPKSAANACGIGRINWKVVESYSAADLKDFATRHQLLELLATNAKTIKPRPSGRHGIIRGLNLAPHFYPNLLNLVDLTKSGTLELFDRSWFNGFDGSEAKFAAEYSGVAAKDLLSFCTGASKWCRQTCLVLTGQHPSTLEASRAKMKATYAFLAEPELFVALLDQQLRAFSHSASRKNLDAVVRLNMLSDIPWYSICPELLEAHEGEVTFYDYTKVPYWGRPEYERVRHLLDLTFSFSGSNDNLCAEALKAGERIAVVFAPANPQRRATVQRRTTWTEIEESGLVDNKGRAALFGGRWEIVDGDESDYRIDDPQPSIVALNFKEPTAQSARLAAALPESRAKFGIAVPDEHGYGEAYVKARGKRKLWEDTGLDPDELSVQEVLGIDEAARSEATRRKAQRNPAEADTVVEQIEEEAGLAMTPIDGTRLLIGPHVPTILND